MEKSMENEMETMRKHGFMGQYGRCIEEILHLHHAA